MAPVSNPSWLLAFAFLGCFCAVSPQEEDTDFYNYKIISLHGLNETLFHDEALLLQALNFTIGQDLMVVGKRLKLNNVDVLVKPEHYASLKALVRNVNIPFGMLSDEMARLRYPDLPQLRRGFGELRGESTYDRFMNWPEIMSFLRSIEKKHPQQLRLSTIGQTWEEENITMVTIADDIDVASKEDRPIIFVDAGIHAREWISVSSTVYLIEHLLKTPALIRAYQWNVVPVINIDGYKISWTHNRLKRRNNRPSSNATASGVDLNRNFDFDWNNTASVEQEIFPGPKPFSEPESRAVRDAILKDKTRIRAYMNVHSHGQVIIRPPGVINTIVLSNDTLLILNAMSYKMKMNIRNVTGAFYKQGTVEGMLNYSAPGISIDWALFNAGIPVAFSIELRDENEFRFELPNSFVKPTALDLWTMMETLHDELQDFDPSNVQNYIANSSTVEEYLKASAPCFDLLARKNFTDDYDRLNQVEDCPPVPLSTAEVSEHSNLIEHASFALPEGILKFFTKPKLEGDKGSSAELNKKADGNILQTISESQEGTEGDVEENSVLNKFPSTTNSESVSEFTGQISEVGKDNFANVTENLHETSSAPIPQDILKLLSIIN